MKYINSTKGSLIVLVIITLLSVFLPQSNAEFDFKTVLTIATFLFAILAGFDLSRMYSRYTNVRQSIAEEDARLLSFYAKSKIYGQPFSNRIKKIIDEYCINFLDYGIWKSEGYYYKPTSAQFLQLYSEMEKIKKYRHEGTFESMLDDLSYLEAARNRASVFIYAQMTLKRQYFLFLLTLIILLSLFVGIRAENIYSQIITISLSTSLILILLLLRDANNFMIQPKGMGIESKQEVLEFMGLSRYYNKLNQKRGFLFIPEQKKKYRLGTHRPGEKRIIKIINP
jgi:hypothetical protein